MKYTRNRFRTTVLVGASFLGGTAVGPAIDLTSRFVPGIKPAIAQTRDMTDTYRLLKLFGDAFEKARSEYVDPIADRILIENAIDGMLSSLDPHSAYMNAIEFRELQEETSGKFGGIGIEIVADRGFLKVVSVMDGTPAFKAGMTVGDVVTRLNGKPVQELSDDEVLEQIRGPVRSKITLTIKHQNADHPVDVSMRREIIHIQVVTQRMEPDNVGYVRFSEFTEQADQALRQSIKSLKRQAGGRLRALVLDLRNNPGGLIDQAVAVCGEFIARGAVVSTRSRDPDNSIWLKVNSVDILEGAPLVVLINGGSASASEIVAGALQDHRRAVLVGGRSFGKGSVQTVIPLPNQGAMRLTTARYYTPSGRSIQGVGIAPDVPVAETYDKARGFDPEHETDLNHVLANDGGAPGTSNDQRTDLLPIAGAVPSRPPRDFPQFDPNKPDDTDFQLQQALVIAGAMAAARSWRFGN